ncbi:MAG: hypothetical protein PHF67_03325 [Candidatus Nanoarchaeia archaeon]|nr:hypothetical protein [Candidatus Nanoarchaeia archaeon]
MNQKVIGIISGIVLALVLIGALGFVYAQQSEDTNTKQIRGTGFVDANNNGICDHIENGDCPRNNMEGRCNGNTECPMHKQGRGSCHATVE